jgi:hypothetical protein
MARSTVTERGLDADVVIQNVGAPEIGIRRLLEAIRGN